MAWENLELLSSIRCYCHYPRQWSRLRLPIDNVKIRMVIGPWPSVVTFLRVFHGAVTDLDEVFLPSYYHFWPRLDFWPNTALVLVWDEESEEDRKAARRLHEKWDAIFANKERLASGVNPRRHGTSWVDLFERKPPSNVVCDVKKQGGRDRVSNHGYIRQASAFYEADQTLLRNSALLETSDLQLSQEELYILLCDSDMAFVAPAHPLALFDRTNMTGPSKFRPRLLGVWGRSAEGGISRETNFQSTPSVATFMDQQPWTIRFQDFPSVRERIRQAVFSNLHRFFIADLRKGWPEEKSYHEVPIALVRWTGRDGAQRTELVRFYSHKPARPLRAFYRQPDIHTRELPFAEMQIAWFEMTNVSQSAERIEPKSFVDFSFSTAMGVVWRCAHAAQAYSLHDRSASNANVLLNNLFWMPQKKSYTWHFRKLTVLPDPVLQAEFRRYQSTSILDSRLEKWYKEEAAARFEESTALAFVQSLPLSRFHLAVLGSHDLSRPAKARRAARALDPLGRSCKDHPHGHKILVHWNAVKTARKEAQDSRSEPGEGEVFMPHSRFALLQICLYDAMWNGAWGQVALDNTSGSEPPFGRLAELCCAHFASRWCKTPRPCPQVRKIQTFPQTPWGARCPATSSSTDRAEIADWECPAPEIFQEDSFWRVAMILNQHLLRNPFWGQPCEVQVRENSELLRDRLYLSTQNSSLLGASIPPDRAARISLRARLLKIDRSNAFGLEGDCAAAWVYASDVPDRTSGSKILRCVAISDTHMLHDRLRLPAGDVLIHCGDFSNEGTEEECADFCRWASHQPFRHKLLVCGNHDLTCDESWYQEHWQAWHESFQSPARVAAMLEEAGITVMAGSGRALRIAGVCFYGSPRQPRQPKGRRPMAFGLRRGAELKEEWAKIPTGIDVLLTHTPPANILDIADHTGRQGQSIGCEELAKAVSQRTDVAVHVFGHVHGSYGIHRSKKTCFINAASAAARRGEGGLLHAPIVFDITKQL
ncbi:Mpped1 [Symbiodinium sp. CCMP2456]|nr:Mpped1 [Symbiodinium sp. CCMP2456]